MRKSAPRDTGLKLVSVRVTGTQRYTQAEVVAASGLNLGAPATEDDFKKATQELGDTGLFTNLSYSYASSSAGTKLDLELVDNDKLVSARFENFVWFPDDVLMATIQQTVPLFKGEVPLGGELSDAVSDALQTILLKHSLSARADYIRESDGENGPVHAVVFRATGLNIRVHDVTFPGAGPAEMAELSAAAKRLLDTEYLRSDIGAYAKAELLPVYQKHGFLRTSFANAQPKVVQEDSDVIQVDVAIPVNPGPQYKVASISWQGNTVFPAEKFEPLLHLKTGESANAIQLRKDLEQVHKLYGTRGYMTASVKPEEQLDNAAATVAYQLEVNEGEVFHLGDLDFLGVDTKTADRLRGAWELRDSDPYDTSYPQRFIKEAWKLLPASSNWTVSVHEAVNEKDKTVDLTLRYVLAPGS